MSNLFKIAILAAPLAALIFYYVVLQQQKMDIEMKKEDLKFEQQWNEFKAQSPFVTDRQKYEQRAAQAAEKQKEIEQKEKEREEKINKFESEFEKSLEEVNKEKGGK